MKITIKYLRSITCAIVLLTLSTPGLLAQADALSAVQKIAAAYNCSTAIHFTGEMKMYDKNMAAKVVDRMHSSYTLQNGNFSCSIGPVSMLMNEHYFVSADNNDKLIVIGRRKNPQAREGNPVLNLGLLTNRIVVNKIKAILFVRGSVSVVQLSDAEGNSGFSSCTIEFTPATGYMRKVILETVTYNNEGGKAMVLEINYTEPVPVPPGKYLFSERSFFSVVDKKIQLGVRYKHYQLINQLQ